MTNIKRVTFFLRHSVVCQFLVQKVELRSSRRTAAQRISTDSAHFSNLPTNYSRYCSSFKTVELGEFWSCARFYYLHDGVF